MKGMANLDYKAFLKGVELSTPFLESLALVDVRARAERIAETAKSLAPVGSAEEGDPDPGALREDIGIKAEGIDAKGPYVDVGTREPYGMYVEFGTADMAAEPFLRPAIASESGSGAGVLSRVALAPIATSTLFKRIRKPRGSAP